MIRASGGFDLAVTDFVSVAASLCPNSKGTTRMTVATLGPRPGPTRQHEPEPGSLAALRLIVLARLAADDGASRPELVRELGPLLSPTSNRLAIDVELAALVRGALAIENKARFMASPAGLSRLLAELGLKALPKTWDELREGRLVAKALGIEHESAARIKSLGDPDRLRAEILAVRYGFKLRGQPTSSKLRAELALVALERAFGAKVKPGVSGRSALNAKAARTLAGQLLEKPRDTGTDNRLVALLAAEIVGAAKVDTEALRLGLLRRLAAGQVLGVAPVHVDHEPGREAFETHVPVAAAAAIRQPHRAEPAPAPAAVAMPVTDQPQRPAAANRPGLGGFVKAVQDAARQHAEGWPGNRKAFVARVWQAIAGTYPAWGLSAVEFKAMLAEAHRTGHLVLATADLKDKRQLKELQESAITYKNTVWHLVRVDD